MFQRVASTLLCLSVLTSAVCAAGHDEILSPGRQCSSMETWDVDSAMCMPLAMPEMPMSMLMMTGNAFGVYTTEGGRRGRSALSSPNMFMIDAGHSVSDAHYFNIDLMLTSELWTVPVTGYPELLQIGEDQANGQPFIDAQHPHSSPLMGLTLSDTVRLNADGKSTLKLFFSPRGESTDGPLPFMHRFTGQVNPDAPLGHHVGQDVGHISSTVVGSSLKLDQTRIEVSTFYGAEPQPTHTDLPMGTPDSLALRLAQEFSLHHMAMASVAYVNSPEPDLPDISYEWRGSASLYDRFDLGSRINLDNTLIYGFVTAYDRAPILHSVLEEFVLSCSKDAFWGRGELLQRTPVELQVPLVADPNGGQWVGAVTLGYTRAVKSWDDIEARLGASGTIDFLPNDFAPSYGATTPITTKVFVQFAAKKMWDF